VWIRHAGRWLTGFIHCWFVDGDLWVAWMQHVDPDPERPWAIWGMYRYDGGTIRRRHHPAATVHVTDATPELTTQLRDLGYAVTAVPGERGVLAVG
jgi:hypothetical protein